MDNLIKYVRNRNPLSENGSQAGNTPYSNLEDDSISVKSSVPKSYSSTAIHTENEFVEATNSSSGDTSEFEIVWTFWQINCSNNKQMCRNIHDRSGGWENWFRKISIQAFFAYWFSLDGRCNGNDDSEHIGARFALWLASERVAKSLNNNSEFSTFKFNFKTWKMNASFFKKVVFCGMMLSGAIWGKLCDFYGRKTVSWFFFKILFILNNMNKISSIKCLILCTLFTFYFGALSSLSPVFSWLLILRGLVGFGIGGAPQSVVLYAEFLPSKQIARW